MKRGKRTLEERSVQGTLVGIHVRTGEHVIALPSGKAICVRIIHRLSGGPEPQRYDAEPAPRNSGREQPAEDSEEAEVGGSKLERSQAMKGQNFFRELRIENKLLEKHGLSDDCIGCLQRQIKKPWHRPHSDNCRRRIRAHDER